MYWFEFFAFMAGGLILILLKHEWILYQHVEKHEQRLDDIEKHIKGL